MSVLRSLSLEEFQHIVAICTTKWMIEGGDPKELPAKLAGNIEHEVFVRTYISSKPKEESSAKGPRLSKIRAAVLKTDTGKKPRKAKRGRKRMTPAERKAVGKRMRMYWATRRKAKD